MLLGARWTREQLVKQRVRLCECKIAGMKATRCFQFIAFIFQPMDLRRYWALDAYYKMMIEYRSIQILDLILYILICGMIIAPLEVRSLEILRVAEAIVYFDDWRWKCRVEEIWVSVRNDASVHVTVHHVNHKPRYRPNETLIRRVEPAFSSSYRFIWYRSAGAIYRVGHKRRRRTRLFWVRRDGRWESRRRW